MCITKRRIIARASAYQHLNGDPMPTRNYGLNPDSSLPFTWTHRADTASVMGNVELLAWMWRHCPDIPAPLHEGRSLVSVIDDIGLDAVAMADDFA